MKTANEPIAASNGHQDWLPMLDMATREVFELMLGTRLTVPEPAASDGVLEITSMVGLAGKLCGVMGIRCSERAAALMASKMLGVDPDKIGPELCDAFGEVCNMVAGNFKNKITGLGDGCVLSVPTVITGNDYALHPLADTPPLEIHFLFESLPLVISLQVQN